jgi:hypothetical protein
MKCMNLAPDVIAPFKVFHDTQHKDIQCKNTQHNNKNASPSITTLSTNDW